ncbi:MAG: HypC/HybG/HupF family hydrogenase formation chaperone [Bacillota bacterium]|nr:HypC/HybG/HupF family hydrogenase formation chaperone [Bacillota bacterium]
MCIAVPGKLIEIDGKHGKVDVNGNILPVELGVVNAKLGDFLLIHAGCAISVLRNDEKDELTELFSLLDEVVNENN